MLDLTKPLQTRDGRPVTLLPTRDDGGIDCTVLAAVLPMELSSQAAILLAQKFAAHTREKCARIAAEFPIDSEDEPMDVADAIAAAIRKMED